MEEGVRLAFQARRPGRSEGGDLDLRVMAASLSINGNNQTIKTTKVNIVINYFSVKSLFALQSFLSLIYYYTITL